MFEDLFDFDKDEEMSLEISEDEEIWDTGAVWSTGQVPSDIWTLD